MAEAWHHRSDALSSIGSFIGIFGARLGYPVLDPVASVVIACFILKVAYDIFKETLDRMVDHACDEETEQAMRQLILSNEGVSVSYTHLDVYKRQVVHFNHDNG